MGTIAEFAENKGDIHFVSVSGGTRVENRGRVRANTMSRSVLPFGIAVTFSELLVQTIRLPLNAAEDRRIACPTSAVCALSRHLRKGGLTLQNAKKRLNQLPGDACLF